ncbi:MAG: hypothetical protein ACR5LA_07660, partial [Wolbachia sp.]
SKIILLHFYSLVTSLLFDNMFPEFTLFSSLFYRFLIRNWGYKNGNVLCTHSAEIKRYLDNFNSGCYYFWNIFST